MHLSRLSTDSFKLLGPALRASKAKNYRHNYATITWATGCMFSPSGKDTYQQSRCKDGENVGIDFCKVYGSLDVDANGFAIFELNNGMAS